MEANTAIHTLLLLTAMSGGDVRVTLSEATSAQHCEASRNAVITILTRADKAPLLTRCGSSTLRLTPFAHGTPEAQEVHRYRVEVPADASQGFSVQPLAPGQVCTPAPQASPAVYCARTAQTPRENS